MSNVPSNEKLKRHLLHTLRRANEMLDEEEDLEGALNFIEKNLRPLRDNKSFKDHEHQSLKGARGFLKTLRRQLLSKAFPHKYIIPEGDFDGNE